MKNMNFTPNFFGQEMVAHGNRTAAATNLNGTSVDCENVECLTAIVEFGTISATAVTSLQWQNSDDNSAWADIEDASASVPANDDNEYYVMELIKPEKRYNRLVVERGTANAGLRSAQYWAGGLRYTRGASDDGSFAYSNYPAEYHVNVHIGSEDDETHTNPKA